MKVSKSLWVFITSVSLVLFFSNSCQKSRSEDQEPFSNKANISDKGQKGTVFVTNDLDLDFSKHKVTFIELGANKCIPCRAMQPIMKEIAETYTGQVQVVFYDVWKDPNPARKYGIQLIPTQVFIDQNGQEFYRHVGFFPKEEIVKLLKDKGVK